MKFNVTTTWRESIFPEYDCIRKFDITEIDNNEVDVEINSLEEMIRFVNAVPCEVILSDGTIELYDNYRE